MTQFTEIPLHYQIAPTSTKKLIPVVTETATQLSKPTLGFVTSDANVFNVDYLDAGQLMIVIEMEHDFKDQYWASVGSERFKCEILKSHPNRLYCYGMPPKEGSEVDVSIFLMESDVNLLEFSITVPTKPSGSTTKGNSTNNCNPGVWISCKPAPRPDSCTAPEWDGQECCDNCGQCTVMGSCGGNGDE